MNAMNHESRREFLRTAAGIGGGLIIGFTLPAAARFGAASALLRPAAGPHSDELNAFVSIDGQGTATLIMHKSEMGQGVYTGLVQLLAEELECDLERVRIETAPVAAVYNNPVFPVQFTGGSMSISSCWSGLRLAGAAARMMLIEAAAREWRVGSDSCRAEQSFVYGPDGRKASYGRLAAAAGKLPAPDPAAIRLKPRSEFAVIGKSIKRIEVAEKINGSGKFGLDVRLPGMLRAVVARPPTLGSTPKSIDDAAARAVRGVVTVVRLTSGVAVVAVDTYAARKGRDALVIEWQAPDSTLDTERMRAEYQRLSLTRAPLVARNDGDVEPLLRSGGFRHLEAFYEVPFLSHAPMEPLNCAADWRPDRCDIWTGTQMQSPDRAAAAEVAGLPPEKVFIHTMLLGGGFGRRANPASDFVREAAELSRKLAKPVQIVWTREDDMHGGWYRPQLANRLKAALAADGKPIAWQHTVVGQSIMAGTIMQGMVQKGIDPTSVEGAADLPYAIANVRVDLHTTTAPVKVLWWRSVGHSNTAFAVESFLDECAATAGKDPMQYRRSLLDERQGRHRAVLELLAEKSGWTTPLPAGRARGVAIHESFGSVVGEVAEVSMQDGLPRVHRVVAVIDCGTAVNPQMIAGQIESAVNYGLSAALYGEITFAEGTPQQSNFDTYRVLRINEAPAVETHIVPSEQPPSGVGEPGLPPIAPAVANAIFALTGKRVRRLPMVRGGQFTA
ncbi:MAG: molybdopterin cofactor-binding domain-containing protein [Steroidobacteraceae bacterium]|jgi:isoquinoline 1-oxidoreductase beta subunit